LPRVRRASWRRVRGRDLRGEQELWPQAGRRRIVADRAHRQHLRLIGPNGSGKSTTIRMVMRIYHPDGGSIRVLGHDATTGDAAPTHRLPARGTGALSQDAGRGAAGVLRRAQGGARCQGRCEALAGTTGAGRLLAPAGGYAVERDGAEDPVHRHRPAQAGTADPRRAVQRTGSGQHGP